MWSHLRTPSRFRMTVDPRERMPGLPAESHGFSYSKLYCARAVGVAANELLGTRGQAPTSAGHSD